MRPEILQRVADEGHVIFEHGAYNVNIIGQRTIGGNKNQFDDRLHLVFHNEAGEWQHMWFWCTTDPGTYWLENPSRVSGTAILVAGQYRGAYKIAKHRGLYDGLCQREGVVRIYRDSNRDDIIDAKIETEEEGYFGINIHKAGRDSTQVNRWSAGCTVVGSEIDWDVFISIVKKSADMYGNKFTYTLIEG